MKIIRVFPRKTKATPVDEMAFIGNPPLFRPTDCDIPVRVSVTFTWDIQEGERLKELWSHYYHDVTIGGPALNERGEDFTPGMYLKPGYVITSRGCPNHCWFCSVPMREGDIRELPIAEGWNVLDDNLLACSDDHLRAVFAMLARQKELIEFTGGLEAARLQPRIVHAMKKLRIKQMFFAYDTPDDLEPLQAAGKMLIDVGFTIASHAMRCFVLCGYPKDTIERAEKRILEAMRAGFTPMAMLWKDETGKQDREWRKFQREWARPAIIHSNSKGRKCRL